MAATATRGTRRTANLVVTSMAQARPTQGSPPGCQVETQGPATEARGVGSGKKKVTRHRLKHWRGRRRQRRRPSLSCLPLSLRAAVKPTARFCVVASVCCPLPQPLPGLEIPRPPELSLALSALATHLPQIPTPCFSLVPASASLPFSSPPSPPLSCHKLLKFVFRSSRQQ